MKTETPQPATPAQVSAANSARPARVRHAENSSLTPTDSIADGDVQTEIENLLMSAASLKMHIDTRIKEMDRVKDRLAVLCEAHSLANGVRNMHTGFEYHGWKTRKTLSKELLLNHVTAKVLDSCYKESEEYLDVKIIVFG